ncbi:DUF305 domain-containing protein [Actinomycetospora sp. CA-053990]|uniref:DUF305 domain-containing protein n=1 Tax=Actinomycetospora sp. CA-053990 TaxID=3239891 RepID=UPI003D8EE201
MVLGGCGASAAAQPPPRFDHNVDHCPGHNAADVRFLRELIPQRIQGVAMVSQVGSRAASPEVKALAGRIDMEQEHEIDQMNQMLINWGERRPQPGTTVPGEMLSDDQLQQLAATGGPAFDHLFLQLMIDHHRAATRPAQLELAEGLDPGTMALAGRLVAAQETEIVQMEALQDGH